MSRCLSHPHVPCPCAQLKVARPYQVYTSLIQTLTSTLTPRIYLDSHFSKKPAKRLEKQAQQTDEAFQSIQMIVRFMENDGCVSFPKLS